MLGEQIAPIEPRLAAVDSLIVVPDALLHQVPFDALRDATRHYLIERLTITVAPSARMFIAMSQRPENRRGLPETAVVFANPAIPRDRYPDLPSLYGSESEATLLKRRYPRTSVFTGEDATASRFLALAPEADVVHFAGHAVVLPRQEGGSALLLASDGARPGLLPLPAISQLHFRSRLVVLAACSTLTGRNAAVEGVASLAGAFLIAGARSVIGTLWDIDDQTAAPFMERVHAEVAAGATPAVALRSAQLAAIHSDNVRDQHPSRWAAFSVTGE